MAEYFMIGILCIINPMNRINECIYFNEDPIKYYQENICLEQANEKVNEMGVNLTINGYEITRLQIACIVDKTKKNA